MQHIDTLEYLRLGEAPSPSGTPVKVRLLTNFTDGVLARLLRGVLAHEGIAADISSAPYKQYHLLLKDRKSELYRDPADITFVFFDVHPYAASAFTEEATHWKEVFADLEAYCGATPKPVVVMTFPIPYRGAYGNHFEKSPLYSLVAEANAALKKLSDKIKNLYVSDVNAVLARIGEPGAREWRGLQAFDLPFTNDFLLEIAQEWASYVRALQGRAKKCLVVDLDNTLWGGVLGEQGPDGIALGPDYPGSAFVSFQRALLEMYGRGIILAINSKNNADDVAEVFEKNPHMVLEKKHFAAIRTNWEDKAKNLEDIAKELNIGLDSMVFLDDDPMNRNMVRTLLPEVAVPEMPSEPERYVPMLHGLTLFNQFSLTDEDTEKGRQYAQEQEREQVKYSAKDVDEYIRALDIRITPRVNERTSVPRISQLTQKTNQFNLTTHRYGEKEIENFMETGQVYEGDVRDKFGDYGKTVVAITKDEGGGTVTLDTLLMSCRVMGRGVEYAFMAYVADALLKSGKEQLAASFAPTAKNYPCRDFLPSLGFKESGAEGETVRYSLPLEALSSNAKTKYRSIIFE